MSDRRRCTVFDNANPREGKALLVPADCTLEQFIDLASKKLGISGKKAFLEDGGEIDDVNLIRDNDSVFISDGAPFRGVQKESKQAAPPVMYSVAVMGPGAVGKSALTLQYVQGVFVVGYEPTIEDAYRKNAVVDGKPCYLDILDTAGQEDYTALRSTWMRERDGFVLVFSITERNSFDELQKFYDQLSVMHEDKIPPVVICGNKCDLADKRVVTTEEGQRLANTYGAVAYIETSAKTGQNIDRVFSTLVREIRSSGGVKARNREPEKPKKRFWCSIL